MPLDLQSFAKLVSIGKRINDFMIEDGAGNEKLDDELGVAVVFDEEDEQVPRAPPFLSSLPPRQHLLALHSKKG